MTLRWRLALLACTVSGLMIAVTFAALLFAVRGTLVGVLNDSLRAGVDFRLGEEARRALGEGRFGHSPDRPNTSRRPTPPGLATVATLDEGGEVIAGERPVDAPLRVGFARMGGYRVLTERAPSGRWIQAFRSESELLSSLAGVTRVLLFVAPAALLLGLAGGYLLADRALRPVDAVTRLAGRIAASGRYAERVPVSPGRDEMARLTATINAMLDRLGGLIERERTFALAAAHELRTPLAVIRARASLTLERERDPAQYKAALAEVRGVSADLSALTDRLLALARSGGPARAQDADLADVALEVAEAQSAYAELRGVQVALDLASAPARGDPAALRLAASNLLQNALRYGGGRVRVQASGASLIVEDDGPGIPESEMARLLLPFQRGAGLQGSEGAGLGLALVSAVAEQHGGQLILGRSVLGGLRAELRLSARNTPKSKRPELIS